MMSLVMGANSARTLARACELGLAMQLTNIARDVGEDARNGRLYLPRQWLREAGVDPDAWLRAPRFDSAVASVIGRLLQAADALYARAEHGVAELPRDCRSAIMAARLVYAEIGEQLARDGLDSVSRRAVVSKRRKLALIARATGAALRPPPPLIGVPAMPAVQFLVEAAAAPSPMAVPAQPATVEAAVLPMAAAAPRSFDERVAWIIDLFERQVAHSRAYR
jgi:phytoene synthase